MIEMKIAICVASAFLIGDIALAMRWLHARRELADARERIEALETTIASLAGLDDSEKRHG